MDRDIGYGKIEDDELAGLTTPVGIDWLVP
jgi:hypothetical protein